MNRCGLCSIESWKTFWSDGGEQTTSLFCLLEGFSLEWRWYSIFVRWDWSWKLYGRIAPGFYLSPWLQILPFSCISRILFPRCWKFMRSILFSSNLFCWISIFWTWCYGGCTVVIFNFYFWVWVCWKIRGTRWWLIPQWSTCGACGSVCYCGRYIFFIFYWIVGLPVLFRWVSVIGLWGSSFLGAVISWKGSLILWTQKEIIPMLQIDRQGRIIFYLKMGMIIRPLMWPFFGAFCKGYLLILWRRCCRYRHRLARVWKGYWNYPLRFRTFPL